MTDVTDQSCRFPSAPFSIILIQLSAVLFFSLYFLHILPPHKSTLFPYTTLFRSHSRELRSRHWLALPIAVREARQPADRSEEHTSELQSLRQLVCRLLLENKN